MNTYNPNRNPLVITILAKKVSGKTNQTLIKEEKVSLSLYVLNYHLWGKNTYIYMCVCVYIYIYIYMMKTKEVAVVDSG